MVNWKRVSCGPYGIANAYIKTVGKKAAKLLDYLVKNVGLQLDDIHLIGYSLGAHAVGHAGQYMKSGRPGRITGCDPASLGHGDPGDRQNILDATDGKFVDIIHTTAKGFGTSYSHGHVDFFPNGGLATQPSCDKVEDINSLSCSHAMSYIYFGTSITEEVVMDEVECKSVESWSRGKCTKLTGRKIEVGANIKHDVRGSYFLKVGATFEVPTFPNQCLRK